MKTSTSLLVALAGQALALPAAQPDWSADHARAGAVRRAFETAWNGYYKYAFPHDTLLPLTNSYMDDRDGWGLTPFDALDTAIVMNYQVIVNEILDLVPTINFTTTHQVNDTVSLFETTIRYLGGMLSSYDLLKGPYKRLPYDPKKVDPLLSQAKTLADTLSLCFDTPTGVADGYLVLNPKPMLNGATSSNLAEMGSLILEWTRLSDLTGDPKYHDLAAKCESYLIHPTGSPQPWPGLVGNTISIETGEFLNSDGGWIGGSDSFYEYLIKMYVYDPENYKFYRDRWIAAADSTIEHLASHPTTRKNITFLSVFSGQTTQATSEHLASFAGGNFILAGTVLKEDKYTQFGLQLAESYFQTYTATASDIGPESFSWIDDAQPASSQPQPPSYQLGFYDKAGFWVDAADYILRPETMESIYYAYRATGDNKWRDFAWQAFNSINTKCRAGSGYSGITNVSLADGGSFDNVQQSFFLAETLKYLYLIFEGTSAVQTMADGNNQFVFNTEAHPMHVKAQN